jgi:hypothetical protein
MSFEIFVIFRELFHTGFQDFDVFGLAKTLGLLRGPTLGSSPPTISLKIIYLINTDSIREKNLRNQHSTFFAAYPRVLVLASCGLFPQSSDRQVALYSRYRVEF